MDLSILLRLGGLLSSQNRERMHCVGSDMV